MIYVNTFIRANFVSKAYYNGQAKIRVEYMYRRPMFYFSSQLKIDHLVFNIARSMEGIRITENF